MRTKDWLTKYHEIKKGMELATFDNRLTYCNEVIAARQEMIIHVSSFVNCI